MDTHAIVTEEQSPPAPPTTPTPSSSQSSRGKHKTDSPPAGQKQQKRRQLFADPPPVDLAALMKSQFATMTTDLANQQKSQLSALQTQFQQQYEAYQEKTAQLHNHVQAHDGRLTILEDQQSKATSKLNDLTSRVANLEHWLSENASSTPTRPPAPNLSFPARVDTELAARITKAREFQAQNVNSFVIFFAKDHLDGKSPEVFAQRVANRFGGKQAVVDKITWLGVEKLHLKVTLTLPMAEEIGAAYYRDRQSLQVAYGLAPCRTRLLREGIARMTKALRTLRHLLPEILAERVSATEASFLGKDHFEATDFLYPAIRLSTGQVIPVSYLVNNPNLPALTLTTDPTLPIPEPCNDE
jgi:hypothetical protein